MLLWRGASQRVIIWRPSIPRVGRGSLGCSGLAGVPNVQTKVCPQALGLQNGLSSSVCGV